MTCNKWIMLAAVAVGLSWTCSGKVRTQPSPSAELNAPAALTPEQFTKFHDLIKPAADESPWSKISWHASVWEARKQAAALGKPILIWSGGGSAPLGVC